MKIEDLKARVSQIQVKRMLADSKDHFSDKPKNPHHEWRYCNMCGEYYNYLLPPWNERKATKKCCCQLCRETISEIAKAVGNANRKADHAVKPRLAGKRANPTRRRQADVDMIRRLRVLAAWYGDRWFSRLEAARALRMQTGKSLHAHVHRMEAHEYLECRIVPGRGRRTEYRLTQHEECRKALAWIKTKEENR